MSTESQVYVILPVHNRRETTLQFIQTLKAQTYSALRLILVDDGSTDGTAEAVEREISNLSIVRGDGHLWWGGSVAAGLEYLKTLSPRADDLILFCNDDVLLPAQFISIGVEYLKTHFQVLLLAQSKSISTDQVIEKGSKIIWPFFRIVPAATDQEINCAPTRGLMMTYGTYEQVGPWNPQWLPHYCSDYEFTCRAIRKGFPVHTASSFQLQYHTEKTGDEFIQAHGILDYWQRLFSIKSIRNPKTLSIFVWHSCPWYFVPVALLKIWIGAFARFVLFLLSGKEKANL